jgi:hypothetical protein
MRQTSLAHTTWFLNAVFSNKPDDDPNVAPNNDLGLVLNNDTISDLCHSTSSPLDCHFGVDQTVLLPQQTSYVFLVRLVFKRTRERVF